MEKNELSAKLEEEKAHSAFLEKLLRVLYGEGWNKLTISDAQEWHQKQFPSKEKHPAICALWRECEYVNSVSCDADCESYIPV